MLLSLLLLLVLPLSAQRVRPRSRNRLPRAVAREVPAATGLSADLQPLSYDLTVKVPILKPYVGFSASLVFHFNLLRPSPNITLHAVNLYSFHNITLFSSNDTNELTLKSTRIRRDTVEMVYSRPLPKGQYLLTIGEYNGRIGNTSTGVFHRNRQFFSTHLQPSFARSLLPCVDHPSVKTPFRITVIHSTNTVSQSNTIATDVQVVDSEWQKTVFAPTPPLPSYLIAFSVMPDTFIQLSRQTSFGVTVRVHSATKAVALRIIDIAVPAFELLANMLQIRLPMNKMDLVTVDDYEGGMENWGHILLSESLASSGDDAHLVYVISHELAHHWIGNTATVDSWKYICLQEDLTDYLSYKIMHSLLGEDGRYARFRVAKYVEIQLAEDFISPEHSLLLPEDITNEMISSHCYLKGPVFLESLESVVGEEYMLSVLRNMIVLAPNYNLNSFLKYFEEIKVDNNVSLANIYYHWFTTGGFPAISVNNTDNTTSLQQITQPLWPIRLSSTASLPQFLFAKSLKLPSENIPLLVNLNFTTFLRVNYDTHTWTSIFRYMTEEPGLFSPVGRSQLVSDFCYFQSQGLVTNATDLRNSVIDTVYSNPEAFDLCDWNLYWCFSNEDVSLFTRLVRRITRNLSGLFDTEADFGCRNGKAVRNMNAICTSILGVKCI